MLDPNLLWILKNLSDFDNNVLNSIIAMGNFDRIIDNLLSNDINISQVSLKIINNCLSGDGRIVQVKNREFLKIKVFFNKNVVFNRKKHFGDFHPTNPKWEFIHPPKCVLRNLKHVCGESPSNKSVIRQRSFKRNDKIGFYRRHFCILEKNIVFLKKNIGKIGSWHRSCESGFFRRQKTKNKPRK